MGVMIRRTSFILLLISVSVVALCTVQTVSATVPGYTYEKNHTIYGNSDTALTGYPVKFVVHPGMGNDSGPDVYLNGSPQSWPNDMRFADEDDNLLSYWIESYDADSATTWVKITRIPAYPGSSLIKIYSGKPGDLSASNGVTTFSLFDDFNDGKITGWSLDNDDGVNSISETARSGYLRLSTTDAYTDWWHKYDAPVAKREMPLTDGFEVVAMIDADPLNISTMQGGIGVQDATNPGTGIKFYRGYGDLGQGSRASIVRSEVLEREGYPQGYILTDATTNIRLSLKKSGTWSGYVDTGAGERQVFSQLALDVPNMQVALYESTSTGNGDYSMRSDVNYIFLRKYVPGEPTHDFQGTVLPPAATQVPSAREDTGTSNLMTLGLITGVVLIAGVLLGILIIMVINTMKK